jgi:serine protease AprX
MASKKKASKQTRKKKAGAVRVTRSRPRPRRVPAPPPPPASADLVTVLMAIAASAKNISVDATHSPPTTTPPDLLTRRFNDARIGLTTAARIEKLRANLAQLMPQMGSEIQTLPMTPSTVVGDVAARLERLLAAAPQRAPTMIVLGETEEGRKRIEDRWGKAFASKCSKALVQRLTAPAREAAGGAGVLTGVVLEFAEQTPEAILPQRATSRTQRLASMRDAFYKLASPVRAAVEKNSAVPAVQICWLNSTMRVVGQIPAMSEVAHHRDLQMLDVSRVMRREMNVAGLTVNAESPRDTFGVSGTGVRVAVIDGEVNVGHPAFGGRATLQENLTAEAFGSPDPHGTAVAGIICAADTTFSGVAPGSLVMNYKVFPTGSPLGDEFQGILAVEHALRDGADIANCSWGTGLAGDGNNREARAFNKAWTEGLVLIKSAGNDGPSPDSMSSPGDADGVIVVGATEREGTAVQAYSSRGPTANGRHPHLVAPGGTPVINIVTCLSATAGGFGDCGFGTSLAAPIVAGAAALLTERFPTETADQIRERLMNMCRALDGDVNASGAGLLDLSRFNLV